MNDTRCIVEHTLSSHDDCRMAETCFSPFRQAEIEVDDVT